MADPHVITALVRKRAELSGELSEIDRQRRSVRSRIAHVDEALKLFGYGGDPKAIPAVRRRQWMFRRGELSRAVYDVLRTAAGPVPNSEIAAELIRRKGWDEADEELGALVAGKVKDVRKRIGRS